MTCVSIQPVCSAQDVIDHPEAYPHLTGGGANEAAAQQATAAQQAAAAAQQRAQAEENERQQIFVDAHLSWTHICRGRTRWHASTP